MLNFNKKLETLFSGLIQEARHLPSPQCNITFNSLIFPENINLPDSLTAHLHNESISVSLFDKKYEYKPSAKILTDRLELLITAFRALIENEFQEQQTQKVLTQLKAAIRSAQSYIAMLWILFDLDNNNTPEALKNLLEDFTVYIEETFFVTLAKLYHSNQTIKFNDKLYLEFLRKLRQAEIETSSRAGRETFLHIDQEGYFTAEIPLGIREDKPYTNSCYRRDSDVQDNFVLHVMGHHDNQKGTVTIFNQSTRAASYVPVRLPNYTLALMPDDDDDDANIEKNKLYVRMQDEELQYQVIGPNDQVIKNTIEIAELEKILGPRVLQKITSDFKPELLQPYLSQILEITSKRKHTLHRVSMLNATWAQVKQRQKSVGQLNPEATTFTQISLLSPLAEGSNNIDDQQGHEQTLLTYLAFLLQNQENQENNSSMQLRYFVEGVNQMRSYKLSHHLRSQINTRFYNQLMDDLKAKSTLCTRIFSFPELESNVENSWKDIILVSAQNLDAHLKNEQFDDETLNGFILAFETSLEQHREVEKKLYTARMNAWAKNKKEINAFLKANNENPSTLAEYNLIQEFNNLHFLRQKHLYQTRKYNYQLQACVHRLSANLDHEVGVNCNDSKDRTGFENVVAMASYQYMAGRNSNRAPNLQSRKTLKAIQTNVKTQQAKDVGIKNSKANGSPGLEVDPNDVARGIADKWSFYIGKLAKLPYRTILQDHNWKGLLKKMPTRDVLGSLGEFIQQKFRPGRWIKKAAIAVAAAFADVVRVTFFVKNPVAVKPVVPSEAKSNAYVVNRSHIIPILNTFHKHEWGPGCRRKKPENSPATRYPEDSLAKSLLDKQGLFAQAQAQAQNSAKSDGLYKLSDHYYEAPVKDTTLNRARS